MKRRPRATLLMSALLDELGWVNVQQSTWVLDLSAGTDAYASVLAAGKGFFSCRRVVA